MRFSTPLGLFDAIFKQKIVHISSKMPTGCRTYSLLSIQTFLILCREIAQTFAEKAAYKRQKLWLDFLGHSEVFSFHESFKLFQRAHLIPARFFVCFGESVVFFSLEVYHFLTRDALFHQIFLLQLTFFLFYEILSETAQTIYESVEIDISTFLGLVLKVF